MKTELIENFFSTLPKTQVVYRVTSKGNRFYYTLNKKSEPSFCISLTTLIRATNPKADHLIKWMCDMGYEESKKYMNERADYGSIMHQLFGLVLTDGFYDFNKTEEICKGIATKSGYILKDEWIDDFNDDVAGFMQFIIDHKIKPLAIEIVLVSKDLYGTLIDLVCEMIIEEDGFDSANPYKSGARKGEPREIKVEKRITALLNFKSGRKGFYEDNEIQLEFEKRLFQENYPEIKIDKVFNYSPAEWRNEPKYKLTDQTDSVNKEKADHLLAIGKIELMKKLPVIKSISGSVKVGEMPKIEYIGLAEYVQQKHQPLFTETK